MHEDDDDLDALGVFVDDACPDMRPFLRDSIQATSHALPSLTSSRQSASRPNEVTSAASHRHGSNVRLERLLEEPLKPPARVSSAAEWTREPYATPIVTPNTGDATPSSTPQHRAPQTDAHSSAVAHHAKAMVPARIPGPLGALMSARPPETTADACVRTLSSSPQQGGGVDLQAPPWLAALATLDLTHFDESSPFLGFPVRRIKSRGEPVRIPQAVLVVSRLRRTEFGNRVGLFQDPTGVIEGSIEGAAMEAHTDIAIGAVLVLTQVAVLVCGKSRYLTIAEENVLQVFGPNALEHESTTPQVQRSRTMPPANSTWAPAYSFEAAAVSTVDPRPAIDPHHPSSHPDPLHNTRHRSPQSTPYANPSWSQPTQHRSSPSAPPPAVCSGPSLGRQRREPTAHTPLQHRWAEPHIAASQRHTAFGVNGDQGERRLEELFGLGELDTDEGHQERGSPRVHVQPHLNTKTSVNCGRRDEGEAGEQRMGIEKPTADDEEDDLDQLMAPLEAEDMAFVAAYKRSRTSR
ncbi:hypothetical protein CYMTET_39711 [Cymbomonas tetramitiformis]|uniref:Homologous recombination OB-fold protein OB-fold domain-containing protein n=1 Tax=Cymbomonas tetramitiformis TaxID=36881 RepID=A0AAE0C9I7_9CHLO|nr:hypothetical protein CYMTET_39711 [Cymbomonas tetramitiformis]